MIRLAAALLLMSVTSQSAPATTPPVIAPPPAALASMPAAIIHPEARPYDASAAAWGQVNRALLAAKSNGKKTIVVMGANWCHDSRALAGWMATPRFQAVLEPQFQIVYVDVGYPYEGRRRNHDIAKHFGIKRIKGTPTLLIINAEGKRINPVKDAMSWRNAASRSEEEIFRYFTEFGQKNG
jgi:thiol-disulfide isomerase/thioredoxin